MKPTEAFLSFGGNFFTRPARGRPSRSETPRKEAELALLGAQSTKDKTKLVSDGDASEEVTLGELLGHSHAGVAEVV